MSLPTWECGLKHVVLRRLPGESQGITGTGTADSLHTNESNVPVPVTLCDPQISDLFGTSVQNVSYHIINILKDKELDEKSVIKDYLITASDGKTYKVLYYSLEMILAIGYRVRSIRGVQFRQWATRHLSEYLVKGFVMDDERLKNPDGRPDYFDELLQRIRESQGQVPLIRYIQTNQTYLSL